MFQNTQLEFIRLFCALPYLTQKGFIDLIDFQDFPEPLRNVTLSICKPPADIPKTAFTPP